MKLHIINELRADIKDLKLTKRDLIKFGVGISVMLIILGGVSVYKYRNQLPDVPVSAIVLWGLAAITVGIALFIPKILKPVCLGVAILALLLGAILTRLILFFVFYVVITPFSFIMRLTGRDRLKLEFNQGSNSYWIRKEQKPYDRNRTKRQF